MSTKNKNPLDALFAEAVNAVEKVQEETSDTNEEFEIEFVDETTSPSADEVEFEVDLDMEDEAEEISVFDDPPEAPDFSPNEMAGLLAEKEELIDDLQQQLVKAKRIIAKRKKALEQLSESHKATKVELFQQRSFVQRLKERLDRAEGRARNVQQAAEASQKRIHQLEEAIQQGQKKLDRMHNLRKKESQEAKRFGIGPAILAFIPTLDNLERAMKYSSSDIETLVSGIRMASQQFQNAFDKLGVKRVNANVGVQFSPEVHEAMMRVPHETIPLNHIVEELSSGYVLNGRLLRPARVSVAIPTPTRSAEPVTEEAPVEDTPAPQEESDGTTTSIDASTENDTAADAPQPSDENIDESSVASEEEAQKNSPLSNTEVNNEDIDEK